MAEIPRERERTATPAELAEDRRRCLAAKDARSPLRTEEREERRKRWFESLERETAYHEASHCVAHFAVENPNRPRLLLFGWERTHSCHGEYSEMGGSLIPGQPSVGHVWRSLAGRAGQHLYRQADGKSGLGGLGKDLDHVVAAGALSPWRIRWTQWGFLYGQIGASLRRERRAVEALLRQNWHVIDRVAKAALAKPLVDDERALEEPELRALIVDPGDLVSVHGSSVRDDYQRACEECMREWERRGGHVGRSTVRPSVTS